MDIAVRRQGVPRAVLVFAVLALLITLLVATVAFIGTRPSPPLLGAATNGPLAFASGGDIVVIEPDGTGRRTLIAGTGNVGGLAYSPNGERLAYWFDASGGGAEDLIVVDADGSNPVTIASGIRGLTVSSTGLVAGRLHDRLLRADAPTRRVTVPWSWISASFCTSRIFLPRPMDPARGRSVIPRWMRGVPTGRRTAPRSPSAVAMPRRRSACTST